MRAWVTFQTCLSALALGLALTVPGCHGQAHDATAEEERHDLPVTAEDVRILQRADAILSSEAVWNRADTRECPGSATTFSMFCALQKATIEVIGHYDHRRAALQEVRFVIEERGREYEHRLMGFNNDPATSFAEMKRVLGLARERIEKRVR